MSGLHDPADRGDVAAMPVASLWNIVEPIVPDRANCSLIAWRHSAASTANEARWTAGMRTGSPGMAIPSKARAGSHGAAQVSAALTEISRN